MAHKTFISYKYSESQELRDRIIQAMGSDAAYYTGETSESPDMSDLNEYSARDCAPQPLKLSIHSGGIEHPCRCR